MRFYTVKAQISNDGTETRDMRGFDNLDDALVQYHSSLASNIGKVKSIMLMVVNSEGGIHKNEIWKVEEKESEETE